MCKFFSLVSDGKGKPYYFDWELRKKVLSGEIKDYEPDSHTSIADYFGFKKEKEDKLNKYEYNPLTKYFTIDQINTEDDSAKIEKFCRELDFKRVVKPLRVKNIIHPFKIKPPKEITEKDIELVKEWASVVASVGNNVGDSVGDSVGDNVWDSVWDSVRASVWDSIVASVGDSVVASVWDSVRAYCSDFVDAKYKYDFSPVIKLWKKGLVPSFDGKLWRLHGGKNGKILWMESQQSKGG